MLYVADENHIEKKQEYEEIKEKYIRHTFSFEPKLRTVINSVIKERKGEKHSQAVSFFESGDSDVYGTICNNIPISNIRLVSFAFDCFDEILELSDRDLSYIQKYHLMKNILWMVCFFNSKRNSFQKNNEYEAFYDYLNEHTGQANSMYGVLVFKDLKDRLTNDSFRFLPCVRDYIFNGAANKSEILEMLESNYQEENEFVQAYNRLPAVESLEEDEYQEVVDKVISGIREKRFPFSLLCSVANRLNPAERFLEGYDSESFAKLIYESIKDNDYPGRKDFFEANRYYRRFSILRTMER